MLSYPGIRSVDQADLHLTQVLLSLPPECATMTHQRLLKIQSILYVSLQRSGSCMGIIFKSKLHSSSSEQLSLEVFLCEWQARAGVYFNNPQYLQCLGFHLQDVIFGSL